MAQMSATMDLPILAKCLFANGNMVDYGNCRGCEDYQIINNDLLLIKILCHSAYEK